jgi:uncharacterized membrane protein YfcA
MRELWKRTSFSLSRALLGESLMQYLVAVVALKNFLNCWMRVVAVFVLVIDGNVHWKYGAPMAVGGLVGGYIGGIVSHRANRTVVRSIVIVIGLTVAGYCFWKLYNPAVYT